MNPFTIIVLGIVLLFGGFIGAAFGLALPGAFGHPLPEQFDSWLWHALALIVGLVSCLLGIIFITSGFSLKKDQNQSRSEVVIPEEDDMGCGATGQDGVIVSFPRVKNRG